MTVPLLDVVRVLRLLSATSTIAGGRRRADYLADRIRQAATGEDLPAFVERLGSLLGSPPLPGDAVASVLVSGPQPVLAWLREHPKLAAALCFVPRDELEGAVEDLALPDAEGEGGVAPTIDHDLPLRVTLLSPLSHGGDEKSGNAILLRRQVILTDRGRLRMPFYGGNAVRGQMRDLLAEHLVTALGAPPLAQWFFHLLYAGGGLHEADGATKPFMERLGATSAKAPAVREMRDMLPAVSLLGGAVRNRIFAGRVMFGDLRPVCREHAGGTHAIDELIEWSYFTRRDDREERGDEHAGMIVSLECLRAGTVLVGGVDVEGCATPLERACLGHGLRLLAEYGRLGGGNARGYGSCRIEGDGWPDPAPYLAHVRERRDAILDYLAAVGALA